MKLCDEKIKKEKTIYKSNSPDATMQIAKEFAKTLKGGEVLLLKGDLGAGKTAFTKGLAVAFGVEEIVTSPTFTILNEHYGTKLNLYHFDMYRIEDESELKELGFDDYIGKSNGVCAIEWFEKTMSILPSLCFLIEINKISDEEREICISVVNKEDL